jgi:hypothetical protein
MVGSRAWAWTGGNRGSETFEDSWLDYHGEAKSSE